jgi:hypothetical protein
MKIIDTTERALYVQDDESGTYEEFMAKPAPEQDYWLLQAVQAGRWPLAERVIIDSTMGGNTFVYSAFRRKRHGELFLCREQDGVMLPIWEELNEYKPTRSADRQEICISCGTVLWTWRQNGSFDSYVRTISGVKCGKCARDELAVQEPKTDSSYTMEDINSAMHKIGLAMALKAEKKELLDALGDEDIFCAARIAKRMLEIAADPLPMETASADVQSDPTAPKGQSSTGNDG